MRKRSIGIFIALMAAVSAPANAETKAAAGSELVGWAAPGPADLAVLEGLEGDNLAEARAAKNTTLKIESTKKDLDGDGIPELFFFIQHPMFCYDENGCTILVVRRASLSDPWSEIGVITASSPSLVIAPVKGEQFPLLRPLGTHPYSWNGRLYQETPDATPAVPAAGAADH
jgi:hypothetical protein